MSDNENEVVQTRRMAVVGTILAIQVPPGTKIFDSTGVTCLGIVMDGHPIPNYKDRSVYLSTDDWLAAQAAIPAARHPN